MARLTDITSEDGMEAFVEFVSDATEDLRPDALVAWRDDPEGRRAEVSLSVALLPSMPSWAVVEVEAGALYRLERLTSRPSYDRDVRPDVVGLPTDGTLRGALGALTVDAFSALALGSLAYADLVASAPTGDPE